LLICDSLLAADQKPQPAACTSPRRAATDPPGSPSAWGVPRVAKDRVPTSQCPAPEPALIPAGGGSGGGGAAAAPVRRSARVA